MKKTLAIVLVVLLSAAALAGCGGNTAPPEGKYILKEYVMNDTDFMELAKMIQGDAFDPNALYIDFNSDGTYSIMLEASEEGPGTGAFTTSGNKITIDMFGGKAEGTFDSKTVTVEMSEGGVTVKLVFEKQ